jgi:hypothetical protein
MSLAPGRRLGARRARSARRPGALDPGEPALPANLVARSCALARRTPARESLAWRLGLSAPSESFSKARHAARQALDLDPELCGGARRSGLDGCGIRLGLGYRGARVPACDRGQASVRPGSHLVSHFMRAMDRTEESLAESRRARECDPLGTRAVPRSPDSDSRRRQSPCR